MPVRLGELAARFGCELRGDPDTLIERVATLQEAGAGAISFLANSRYRRHLPGTQRLGRRARCIHCRRLPDQRADRAQPVRHLCADCAGAVPRGREPGRASSQCGSRCGCRNRSLGLARPECLRRAGGEDRRRCADRSPLCRDGSRRRGRGHAPGGTRHPLRGRADRRSLPVSSWGRHRRRRLRTRSGSSRFREDSAGGFGAGRGRRRDRCQLHHRSRGDRRHGHRVSASRSTTRCRWDTTAASASTP